ncbi:TIGR03619 family F420-dependent LLM class oxidoreductase [Pseudonocardia lacus]|uniref:TIGR03619 family F420-dependent LLM class oxidoreductase n=1 Tax=Pseudonocardia lacus TaxID=2835865 RepID=UPI001BDC71DA|nr:TIGR03619 family F420-dependent LLM class oxidoreductase [Pseudonocardia lacus]
MKFSLTIALCPLDELLELARTAEECGFASIALPDSVFFAGKVSAGYPYTPDGGRFWDADTPWIDPFVAAAAMGAVTSRIRFYTAVLKLGSRYPVPLARQVASVATITGNRFGFGVGLGWAPEEFEWCGVPYAHRGRRADEAIEVIRLILGGGMVAHHGEFFDFDELQVSPAPTARVPIYVGGHTAPGLRRAARHDGWSSAMITFDDLRATVERLHALRAEAGRAAEPFEVQAVCIDRFGLDGYRQQADIGVTDAIVMPWALDGTGFHAPLAAKRDSIRRFADEVITRL